MLSYFLEKTVKIVNDLIKARGVYLILRVQGGAFNRKKAFKREVTSSTKPNMLPRKYQERFKIYSGISTPSIVTSRPPRDPYAYCSFKSVQHGCQNPGSLFVIIVLPSLVYLLTLDIE